MKLLFYIMNWPLRIKVVLLLIIVSVLPLVLAAFFEIRDMQSKQIKNTTALLMARSDHLVDELDNFHRGYQRSVRKYSRLPGVIDFLRRDPRHRHELDANALVILEIQPAIDPNVRGAAILSLKGVVKIATENQLIGHDLSSQTYIQEALKDDLVTSDIYVAEPEVGSLPTIAYAASIFGSDKKKVGLFVIWVRAKSLWDIAKASNDLAGLGSYAVIFNKLGIRIAHTYNSDSIFHPAGPLEPAVLDSLIAESRYGDETRKLLTEVKSFPEQFARARQKLPDESFFHGFAPMNQAWYYGVGRQFKTVPWTIFYMIPQSSLQIPIDIMTEKKTIYAGLIILMAFLGGSLFSSVLSKPIRVLSVATDRLGKGDLRARVAVKYKDEIGILGESFNSMAERIETQSQALQEARDTLEMRVQERTAELLHATDALRESEQNLAITLNSIGDGVIATDIEGRVVRMNPQAEQLTGWTFEQAQSHRLEEVFHIINEENLRPVVSPVDHVLEKGAVVGLANHTILISRDGNKRPIADSGAPIRDGEGKMCGVVLVFRDQTEALKAEQSLRASEARKAAVMEAAMDAIVIMDCEGKIVDFNTAAEKTFGYSRKEVIGQLLAEVIVPQRLRLQHKNGLERYLATGEEHVIGRRVELPALRKNGTEFPAEIAIIRIRAEGSPLFTSYIRDITERKQASEAEALRRGKEAAEHANAELEAFSYSVSHDLRAPLRVIDGFSKILMEEDAKAMTDSARDFLERIRYNTQKMGRLIDDLLAFSRLGRHAMVKQRVDTAAMVEQTLDELQDEIKNRQIEIHQVPLPPCYGDPTLLKQVWLNLLSNALKYSRQKEVAILEIGEISSNQDDQVTYFIKDNGVGFDMRYADKLFGVFQRLHREEDFEGTGVGLAIVKRIIERHGGRIWAESAVQQGATFYFTLQKERNI